MTGKQQGFGCICCLYLKIEVFTERGRIVRDEGTQDQQPCSISSQCIQFCMAQYSTPKTVAARFIETLSSVNQASQHQVRAVSYFVTTAVRPSYLKVTDQF